MITRRTSQSSKLSGVRSPDYSCPGAATGLRSSPLQRMTRPCASRTLLSTVSWAMPAHAVGTWSPGRADVAPPGLFVDRSYVPVLASATAPAISGAL